MPAVVVRELRKSYGTTAAAAGVSFEVGDGEIFGLIGPNGAGKTTTVECVLGLRDPDAGHIEVCGTDARKHPHAVKEKVGAALQTTSLQDKITPREALTLFGAFYRRRAVPDALLARFGLTEKADVAFDTLSGGQRQRLALALAFVNNPEVVLLDEPTAGLDPAVRRDLRSDIQRIKADGVTVMLTTHDMEEAAALCDRIAVIDRGRIVAAGTPNELIARSTAAPLVSAITAAPLGPEILRHLPAVMDVAYEGTSVRFRSTDLNQTLALFIAALQAQRIDLVELHVAKATLEDVLIELTSGRVAN